MKKFLSLALVLATVLTMSVTAFAADNDNKTVEITYGVNDSYTVTIPDSMKVGTDATVSVSDVVIGYGKQLTVSVSSTNEWKLKNNDDTLGYTMKIGDTDVANNGTVLTAKTGETPSATLTTALVADQKAKYAGNYTDTLTFSVNVADITINATAMTQDELKTAVAAKLANGETDIDITLATDADETVFYTIYTVLSESDVAAGSIDLTLRNVTAIPGLPSYTTFSLKGLKTVTLPDVTTIGKEAFYDCSRLVSVTAPNATVIEANAFESCSKLTTVSLPKCETVGDYAFATCTKLTDVELPAATSIGCCAFASCTALVSIELPKVTKVDSDAFSNCASLTSVTFGTPVIEWGKLVFGYEDAYYKVNTESLTLTFATGQKTFSGDDTNGWTLTETDLTAGAAVEFCGRTFIVTVK